MHPSQVIRGKRSRQLEGRLIILGVTGSIAAVEVVRVVRELIRHGARVRAVMSPEATRILGPEALAFATGTPPVLQLTGDVEHVTLLGPGEGQADLYLIAPATANTISKIAHGIDDTAVTSFASVALGGGVPLVIAPAMHAHMGANPAVRENLDKLRSWGVVVVEPAQAEGEEKLAAPEEVAAAVLARLAQGPWAGRGVIVIGGAGRVAIDDVRSITNESTGRTAVEIAQAAIHRGAGVHLWAGPMETQIPAWIPTVRWRTLTDLTRLVRRRGRELRKAEAVFVPAALPDFAPTRSTGKISSREHARLALELSAAVRILPLLRRAAPRPALLIGFKLESRMDPETRRARARELLARDRLDAVVANDAATLGSEEMSAELIVRNGESVGLAGDKSTVAAELLDRLATELPEHAGGSRRTRSRKTG